MVEIFPRGDAIRPQAGRILVVSLPRRPKVRFEVGLVEQHRGHLGEFDVKSEEMSNVNLVCLLLSSMLSKCSAVRKELAASAKPRFYPSE